MGAMISETTPASPALHASPDIRVGTISSAYAAPAGMTQLRIDFGPLVGTRRAGLRLGTQETPAMLVGARVCAVLDPGLSAAPGIGALPLAMPDLNGGLVLIRPDMSAQDGARPF
jgi:tRNA-binding protein